MSEKKDKQKQAHIKNKTKLEGTLTPRDIVRIFTCCTILNLTLAPEAFFSLHFLQYYGHVVLLLPLGFSSFVTATMRLSGSRQI